MAHPPDRDLTRLLSRDGDEELSTQELASALYADLRAIADRLMDAERAQHTLQPTALVHEAFLRLVDSEKIGREGRLRFLDAAAVTMRRVLVDHARRRDARKRGDGAQRVALTGLDLSDSEPEEMDFVALEGALEKLEALDPRQAKIVELRFYAGLTGDEIADHVGVSRNTVVRELKLARAWLLRDMRS